MKKTLFPFLLFLPLVSGSTPDNAVEWSRIRHWAGNGDNKAALIIQFSNCDRAFVWGYKWNTGDQVTGEQMLRTIAAESTDLDALVQYTGWMGSTVNGIGYSRDHTVLPTVTYNFENAIDDPNISFGFFVPNTGMGQTSAPGSEAPGLIDEAIHRASQTHIIEHPLNARDFGYAAYDYDHWTTSSTDEKEIRWQAGWYNGFWSYWTGTADISTLGYSGLGMSSVTLSDGDVHGWAYMNTDGSADASSGATVVWHTLDYDHFLDPSSVTEIIAPDQSFPAIVRNGAGMLIGVLDRDQLRNLCPGFYIITQGDKTHKVIIR